MRGNFPQPKYTRILERHIRIKPTGHSAVDDGLFLLVQQCNQRFCSAVFMPLESFNALLNGLSA